MDPDTIKQRIDRLRPSKKENVDIAEIAWGNDQRIKELKKKINHAFLAFAKLLYENKENKFYEILGYETFESYIAQEEIGIARRTAYMIMGIYADFIVKHQCAAAALIKVDYTKLDMIRPQITNGNIDELLLKAQTLSRSDLKAELDGKEPCLEHDPITICAKCRIQLNDKLSLG